MIAIHLSEKQKKLKQQGVIFNYIANSYSQQPQFHLG